jgi:lipopolysaccharide transport system ATP-binding protein
MSNADGLPIGTVLFDGVSKRYRLGALGTMRNALTALASRGRDVKDPRELWALKNVSFCVEPGESLGLIGPNGAGKTTVLKLLSNITRPTSGSISISGRPSSLIELGAGFHPELSGFDNIFLNGAILGLKRREIQRRLDAIIAFSELERFIDTPVKRYSSGMYVRLGFAVAAHVEPDVLLVDEVLAVGDASFRQKCMTRMEELRKSGTTLVFVSHNMYQVRRLCDRALLLVEGRLIYLGDSKAAISAYEQSAQPSHHAPDGGMPADDAQGSIMITMVQLLDPSGSTLEKLRHDQPLQVRAQYRAHHPVVAPIIKIRLVRSDGVVSVLAATHHQAQADWIFRGKGCVSVLIDPVQVTTGTYTAEMRIADNSDTMLLASGQSGSFFVQGPAMMHEPDQGTFVPNTTWAHNGSQL